MPLYDLKSFLFFQGRFDQGFLSDENLILGGCQNAGSGVSERTYEADYLRCIV